MAARYFGVAALGVELLRSRHAGDCDHEVFRLTYGAAAASRRDGEGGGAGGGGGGGEDAARSAFGAPAYDMPADLFHELNPFHLLLDEQCRVLQAGAALARVCPSLRRGDAAVRHARIRHPPDAAWDAAAIRARGRGASFLVLMRESLVTLKGQIVPTRVPGLDGGAPAPALLFLGGPRCGDLSEMSARRLYLSDLPAHDATLDYMLLAEQRRTEADLKERHERTAVALKAANEELARATRRLEEEKLRAEALMQRMANLIALFPAGPDGPRVGGMAGGDMGGAAPGVLRMQSGSADLAAAVAAAERAGSGSLSLGAATAAAAAAAGGDHSSGSGAGVCPAGFGRGTAAAAAARAPSLENPSTPGGRGGGAHAAAALGSSEPLNLLAALNAAGGAGGGGGGSTHGGSLGGSMTRGGSMNRGGSSTLGAPPTAPPTRTPHWLSAFLCSVPRAGACAPSGCVSLHNALTQSSTRTTTHHNANTTTDRIEAVRRELSRSNIKQAGAGGAGAAGARDDIECIELLGEGAYGKVWRGAWKGSAVAVKSVVLPANMSGQEKREKMAVMEAAISSALSHPNIVATYTYDLRAVAGAGGAGAGAGGGGAADGAAGGGGDAAAAAGAAALQAMRAGAAAAPHVHSFDMRLVLEFCDRGSLRDALDQGAFRLLPAAAPAGGGSGSGSGSGGGGGGSSGAAAGGSSAAAGGSGGVAGGVNYLAVLDTAAEAAAAVAHLHSQGVLHSDLKARNVLLKSAGGEGRGVVAKVADFGLSVKMGHAETHLSNAFQGTMVGAACHAWRRPALALA